ncbi:MAG TPA: ABC transporter substrate binding protein, partial [Pyrinomonadaceae bacterium]
MIAQRQSRLLALTLWCVACFTLLASATTLLGQPNNRTQRILVLYWDNKDFPGNQKFDESFKAALQSQFAAELECYSEYFETTRFPGQDPGFFRDYLRQKYRGRTIDVLVATADAPLNFLIANHADLFPNAPIVFVANDPPSGDKLSAGPGITGLIHQTTHRQTLELALKLHPNTKQVFVISGSREGDKRFETIARREFSGFENKVQITYLTDLPLNELVPKTASLPPNSIALYMWQQALNEQGKLLETYEVIARISPSSAVPIYGLGTTNLGNGIVGGYLTGALNNGRKVGEISVRILRGTPARDIPVEGAPAFPMFDWRELKRWRISETSLPAQSIVSFKQFSFWDQYKQYVLAVLVLVIFQAALIAQLLFNQWKRRQAELETEKSHRRMREIISNVPGVVWESTIDPETKERKTTFISDHVRTMLGYTPEEWLAEPPGFGMRIMVEEDRAAAAHATEAALARGVDTDHQYRWRAKDGRLVWVESHLSPVLNQNGYAEGLRGVSLDITERKLAEESVEKTEEKNRAMIEAIPDLMFLQTRDGVYLDLHYSDPTNLVVPPQEYLGKNMREILPPELADRFSHYFQRAIETRETQIVEYELTLKGEHRWYESRLVHCGENILSVVRDITERREAELALGESERRLRLAQQAARVGTWEWDLRTGESVWSEMIWELLGLKQDDQPISAERFRECIHPDDRERAWNKAKEVIANGDDYDDEFRIVQPGGHVLWLSSKGRVFRSTEGTAERMIGVNIDITERKLAEETARQTQQKETAILNAIPDLMFLQTRDGVFLDYHAKNSKTLFVAPEKFLGKNMRDVLPSALASRLASCFERAEESSEPQILEYELLTAGREGWYEARIVRSGENILSVVRDITERKQALDELRESEERFATAFRANPQPMTLTTLADGRYVDVNDAFLAVSGYQRDEVVGHTALELRIWETPAFREDFIQKLKEGGTIVNLEIKVRTKDGTRRLFLMSAELVDLGGEKCVLVASTDITERKRAEEALHESEEKYRTLFESIDEGFCVLTLIYDESGRAVDYVFRVTNPAFERHTGWHNVVGVRVRELAPDLEEYWFEKYAQVA